VVVALEVLEWLVDLLCCTRHKLERRGVPAGPRLVEERLGPPAQLRGLGVRDR
jgi:hypothetical protein